MTVYQETKSSNTIHLVILNCWLTDQSFVKDPRFYPTTIHLLGSSFTESIISMDRDYIYFLSYWIIIIVFVKYCIRISRFKVYFKRRGKIKM